MSVAYKRIKRRREAEGLNASAGFTLIELLIVIVVLGILAGVVIFALGGITGKSAVAACQADGATVSTAISAFNAQNPGATVSQASLTGPSSLGFGGPYLQSWPKNTPHYAFTIYATGTYTGMTSPTVGELLVDISATSTATPGTFGNVTGLPADQWAAYTGPSSCDNVQ